MYLGWTYDVIYSFDSMLQLKLRTKEFYVNSLLINMEVKVMILIT